MIRCFLPKDVGTVCTRILGAWVHNKKQHINDNISFVPSSHWFFHLWIISLGPSPSVISFFDIWPPARERHFFFSSSFEKHCQSEPDFHILWPRFQKRRVEPQFGLKMALISLHWVPSLPQKANRLCWCYEDSAAGLKDQQAWHQGVWVLLPCPYGTWVSHPSPGPQLLQTQEQFGLDGPSPLAAPVMFLGPVMFYSTICPHQSLSKLDGSSRFSEEQTGVQEYWLE